MLQGRNGYYSSKYYFVLEGVIYKRHSSYDIKENHQTLKLEFVDFYCGEYRG